MTAARDPYQYFRVEARELVDGIARGVLELENGSGDKAPAARLMRLAHTLKGAARVVRQPAIAELAHALEDVLAPCREEPGPVPRATLDAMLRLLDGIGARLASLDPAPVADRAVGASTGEDRRPFETTRVDVEEMDALLHEISEAAVQLGGLRQGVESIRGVQRLAAALLDHLGPRRGARQAPPSGRAPDRARSMTQELIDSMQRAHRALAAGLDRAESSLQQVGAKASRARLIPVSAAIAPLERAARDAARSVGRRIRLEASGGEIRLDGHVLAAMRDACLHVVRNAVDHGIEPEAERIAAGKPPAGLIRIQVERRGGRLALRCEDDGRGIDVDAVRRSAIDSGAATAEETAALSREGALQLIFRPGVSTATRVSQVSGRGVGLDVVRQTARDLRGEAFVDSTPGKGTTIEIVVPMSLSSLPSLLVESGGCAVALPLDAVRRALWLAHDDIARSPEGDSILQEGRAVPFASLARLLRGEGGAVENGRRACVGVLVRSGGAMAAVSVDRLLGSAEVVVRPLPEALADVPLVSGASLDPEGNPQLVLDPASLVAAASRRPGRTPDARAEEIPAVLVIDDSLTTRMLEQSILESAGYEVDLATSGEEALRKARERRYGVFIVDVEMPGMNGFEFIERARAEAALSRVPAILLTSLSSDKERRRGEEVGARAYIVKSEFDQGRFLQTIRESIA